MLFIVNPKSANPKTFGFLFFFMFSTLLPRFNNATQIVWVIITMIIINEIIFYVVCNMSSVV